MSQRCYSCGRESPLGQPLQHYYGCDVDTFKSPNQDAGGLPELLQQARREFRDSDAAGDVLDWLELRAAGSQEGVRAAIGDRPVYLMGREHVNEQSKPLAELVYGMTAPHCVLFCMKDTEAPVPADPSSPAACAVLVEENAIYIEYCADLLEQKGVSKRIANTLRDCAKFLRNHLTQGAAR